MIEHTCIFGMTFDDGRVYQLEIDPGSMADVQVIFSALQEGYNDFDFNIQIAVIRM